MLDLSDIPGDLGDWRAEYFKLTAKHHAALLEIIDLKAKLTSLNDWTNYSDSELRLRCGELSAQEIRTIRAVLNAINGNPSKTKCGEEYRNLDFCVLEKGHFGKCETASGVKFL